MDRTEQHLFFIVNLNAEIKELERRLSAISARRKKKGAKK